MRKKYTFPLVRVALTGVLMLALPALADDAVPPFSRGVMFGNSGKFIHTDGATLYRAICQGCHMPDARGAKGAGEYPALAANPKLAAKQFAAARVLAGYGNMPSFAGNLSDAQVADVVNYVRTNFDNHYNDTLSADEIAPMREAFNRENRQ